MARYYLHLRDFNGALVEDEDGSDLPSLAVAKEHAMLAMHEVVGNAIKQGHEPGFEAIVIADAHGTHLAAVPLIAGLPSTLVSLMKRPEKVVPPDRLEEYRRHADECRSKAQITDDADDKISWLKLAHAWLEMLPPSHTANITLAGWPETSDEDSKSSH